MLTQSLENLLTSTLENTTLQMSRHGTVKSRMQVSTNKSLVMERMRTEESKLFSWIMSENEKNPIKICFEIVILNPGIIA